MSDEMTRTESRKINKLSAGAIHTLERDLKQIEHGSDDAVIINSRRSRSFTISKPRLKNIEVAEALAASLVGQIMAQRVQANNAHSLSLDSMRLIF